MYGSAQQTSMLQRSEASGGKDCLDQWPVLGDQTVAALLPVKRRCMPTKPVSPLLSGQKE